MKTFIDLFCGIGGFHLALASRGLRCVFASDIDPKAREVYAANFGLEPAGDITKVRAEDIPPHDVLCAGFPCQPFSLANTKAKGMEEARGTLFFEIARIAAHHQPKLLLLENVPRITSFDKGRVLETILRTLDEIGYRVVWHKLNAADYGCATARKRIYFVGVRKDLQLTSGVPPHSEFRDCVANHLRPDLDTKHLERPIEDYVFGSHGNPLSNAQGSKLLGRRKGATRANKIQGARVYDPAGAYPAITCSSKEAVLVPEGQPRRLGHHKGSSPNAGNTGGRNSRVYDPAHPAPALVASRWGTFPYTEGFLVDAGPQQIGKHKDKGNMQGYRVYDPAAAGPSLTADGGGPLPGGGYPIAGKVRRLHIEEAKTIQGFPPDHILSPGNAGYAQLGNSVIPRMVEVIYDAVQPDPAGQGALL